MLRLHTEGGLTFAVLADRFGVSRQRCQQIVARDARRTELRAFIAAARSQLKPPAREHWRSQNALSASSGSGSQEYPVPPSQVHSPMPRSGVAAKWTGRGEDDQEPHSPHARSNPAEGRAALAAFLTLIDIAHRAHGSVVVECRNATALTPEQIMVLWHVDLSGGRATMSQLARALGRAPHTLTSLVDRLERQGLVMRRREAGGDGRRVFASLTDAGGTELERCRGPLADIVERTLGWTGEDGAAHRMASALRTLQELVWV